MASTAVQQTEMKAETTKAEEPAKVARHQEVGHKSLLQSNHLTPSFKGFFKKGEANFY
uniref:Uncharacterized protein n=1 Tax=Picea sitchensis TaxID=3332 RepID=B8LRX4_PICSI|nr:unknown [Picea sitchensis]